MTNDGFLAGHEERLQKLERGYRSLMWLVLGAGLSILFGWVAVFLAASRVAWVVDFNRLVAACR